MWDRTVALCHPKKIYFNSAQSFNLSLSSYATGFCSFSRHQAFLFPSFFSPITKPLSHQASLFSPITKPSLSPSLAFLSDQQAAVRITKPLPLPIHPHPSPNPFSLSPSLAFLSDHQAAITKPRFSLRSTSRCPNHQAFASADSPSPISKSVSLSPSFAFLSDHQAAITKPRFSLRSPSRCPNHQASASASADSSKLRRSLK